jgi:MscS family membrane protein
VIVLSRAFPLCGFESEDTAELTESHLHEVQMEIINQFLARMGISMAEALIRGAVVIAVATLVAAWVVRFLGNRAALAVCRWSGWGIQGQLVEIIGRPLWITVVLLGVLLEMQWIMPSPTADFAVAGAAKTGLAIMWAITLGRILYLICERLRLSHPHGAEVFRLTENIGTALICVMGALTVLSVWSIDLTPFLASAGFAGIVAALAAKDTLANFFGGVNVFLDRPFRTGDYILLNSGERGEVVHIGLRSTKILTLDDILISVPNAVMANSKIVNESAPDPKFRVRTSVSVSYSSDADQVEALLVKVARENALVADEPVPLVRFRAFGESGLEFDLLFWISESKDKEKAIHEVNRAILAEFNRAGIVFAVPQRDIYLHQVAQQSESQ